MSKFTPATRAAFALLVLVTVVMVGATALLIVEGSSTVEDSAREELAATASSISAVLDIQNGQVSADLATKLASLAEDRQLAGVALIHRRGQVSVSSNPSEMRQVNWSALLDGDVVSEVTEAKWGGTDYFVALHPLAGTDYIAAVLESKDAVNVTTVRFARMTALIAGVVWLLLCGGLFLLITLAGNRTTEQVRRLVERLATSGGASEETSRRFVDEARPDLGPIATPFDQIVSTLVAQHSRNEEMRGHVAALFQINPHYALICTLDGHIVDANPAFYAMTGLPFEAVRGNRIEVLNEVMPIEPLFELGRRSLREGSSISGIEYALVNRDDVRLAVQISLRAVTVEGKPGVVIQATDVAKQRNLERQISTFSDALDLMVDQRVSQLTAGNASLGRLLDNAGVVVASFDSGGGTRRWNRAAEDLTGRKMQQVPHFIAMTSVLGLMGEQKEEFDAWFWGSSEGSYAMDVHSADGPARRILWRRSIASDASKAERRVLLGMDLPRIASSGDGQGGQVPHVSPTSHQEWDNPTG